MTNKFIRGSIWWADLEKCDGYTHCTYGKRPVVVISNNMNNARSQIVNVIPCTTKGDDLVMIHPKFVIEEGTMSYALVEQIRTLDQSKLHHYAGMLDESSLNAIENAMLVQYGMDSSMNTDTSIINALKGINKTLKRLENFRNEQNAIVAERDNTIKELVNDITTSISKDYDIAFDEPAKVDDEPIICFNPNSTTNSKDVVSNDRPVKIVNDTVEQPRYSIGISTLKKPYIRKPYVKSSEISRAHTSKSTTTKPRKQYTRWTPDMKRDLVNKVENGEFDEIKKYYQLDRKAAQNYSYKFKK